MNAASITSATLVVMATATIGGCGIITVTILGVTVAASLIWLAQR